MQDKKVALALCTMLLVPPTLCGCGSGEGDTRPRGGKAVTGDEVKKEMAEALDTTMQYLEERKEEALAEFERRLNEVGRDIEEMERKAEAARERGIEVAGDAHEALQEKEREVRLRLDEFRRAAAGRREEAGERLERALRDLEKAYRDFRDGEEPARGKE